MTQESELKDSREAEFARQAEGQQISFLREYWDFLRGEKRWWMAPILLGLLAVGALVVFGGSAAAPFIYALF